MWELVLKSYYKKAVMHVNPDLQDNAAVLKDNLCRENKKCGYVNSLILFFVLFSGAVFAKDPFGEVIYNTNGNIQEKIVEHWYPLHHQSVVRISTLLVGSMGKLAAEEAIITDDLRNGFWMNLTESHWRKAKQYLSRWDVRSSQIDMVAYIVNLECGVMDELGVQWERATNHYTNKHGDNFQMDTRSNHSLATVQIGVLDRKILAFQLSALEEQGKGTIIARPHLLIEDNKEAVIEAGTEIPYSEKTKSGATNAVFKKAVLRLKVRPHSLPDHRLLLNLEVNHDKVSALNVQGTPAIETQALSTEVSVMAGQTLVLGGLFTVSESIQIEQLPGLAQIPVLGHLFRWQSKHLSKKELVVFVSPKIM